MAITIQGEKSNRLHRHRRQEEEEEPQQQSPPIRLLLILPRRRHFLVMVVAMVVLSVDSYYILLWKMRQQTTTKEVAEANSILDQPHQKESSSSRTKRIITRPLQVLLDYQTRHSQDVLQREYEQHNNTNNGGGAIYNRTFVIGFYGCPDSAGNRLHEFFHSLIQAMIHDYTILWKFYDGITCKNVGTRHPGTWCRFSNSIQSCEQVVHRAPWMASFDEWSIKLNLTYGRRNKNYDWHSDAENSVDYNLQEYPRIPYGNKVWLPREVNVVIDMNSGLLKNRDDNIAAADRLDALYSLGAYFVNGMLFHEIFPFHENVLPSPLPPQLSSNVERVIRGGANNKNEKDLSIILHSRHIRDSNDGSDVSHETNCIQQILEEHKEMGTTYDTCRFLLVSDRNATIENLKAFIVQNTSCIPVTAQHTTTDNNHGSSGGGGGDVKGKTMFLEHGPFGLSGFFRDLALVAQYVNGGYIGASRLDTSSSADLFRDLYEYNHVMMNIVEHTNNNNHDNSIITNTMQQQEQQEQKQVVANGAIDEDAMPPVFCFIPKHK